MIPLKTEGLNKDYIQQKTSELIESVKDGEVDPLVLLSSMNGFKQIIENVKAGILEECIDKFDNHGGKELMLNGCKFTKREAGTKYDFSKTEHWRELKAKEDVISKERKAFEKTLKTLTKTTEIAIDDELITVNPPIKTSKTIIQVSIK